MLSVGTNVGSLYAKAAAYSAAKGMDVAMERLATGKRINAARDDAAGVAISSRLEANIRGLNQAVRNALDAQALLDTAEGGLQEVEMILQRIRELAVQAANDTNSASDRSALNNEMENLSNEIYRIGRNTTWAGINLLDGSFIQKKIFVGSGQFVSDSIIIDISGVSEVPLSLNNNNKWGFSTFRYGTEDNFNTSNGAETASVSTGLQAYISNNFPTTQLADIDNGNVNSIRAASFDLSSVSGTIVNAKLMIRAMPLDDNRSEGNDTITISVFDDSGNNVMPKFDIGLGTDASPNSYFNFDWQIDGRPLHPSNGYEIALDLGDFDSQQGTNLSILESINNLKKLDVVISDDTMIDYISLELTTSILSDIDYALRDISASRVYLGAISNRLTHVIENNTNVLINTQASLGRILDADYALESGLLAKHQILQQASIAMLAQANASKNSILKLFEDGLLDGKQLH